MSLKERIYSVLIVSAAEKFNDAMKSLLPESNYDPVYIVSNVAAGRRACAERAFDFIIINPPLPDDIGTRFAIDQCKSTSAAVLLIVRPELYSELYHKSTENGIFIIPKPVSRSVITTTLGFMASTRERLRSTEKKALTLEERMKEIRVINKAKWMLIEHEHMTEEDAHRYIEKSAMDMCITKAQVAREILRKYPRDNAKYTT